MRLFDLLVVLTVMAAAFSYLNFRLIKLPTTIALMAMSLVFCLSLFTLGMAFPAVAQETRAIVASLQLDEVLLHGMLGFLLFAGALHVDIDELMQQKEPIAVLATLGVLLSTLIVAVLMWIALAPLGIGLRFVDCLLLGALISPTDPVAVLGLLKKLGAPKALEIQIAGESLFNNGVCVMMFMCLFEYSTSASDLSVGHFVSLFVREAVGGFAFGLAISLLHTGCSSPSMTIRSRFSYRSPWYWAVRHWRMPFTSRARSRWLWRVFSSAIRDEASPCPRPRSSILTCSGSSSMKSSTPSSSLQSVYSFWF
jgi:NhaP-type Na+/H+ or K+/H+ antiporter